MRKLLAAAMALAASLFAVPALAGDVMFAEDGDAVLQIGMPDGWNSHIDDSRNMLLTAPDHSAAFSLSIVTAGGPLDDLARQVLATIHADPPKKAEAVTISGHSGFYYRSGQVTDSGTRVRLKMAVLRIDDRHVAVITEITKLNLTDEQQAAVDSVRDSMHFKPPS